MKHLLTLDMKNYTDEMNVIEFTHSRALICREGLYAMQRGKRGDYKLPGGRLEPGETPVEALMREVEEETGLLVDEKTIEEIGEITEIRKDVFNENEKYICHSLYYRCDVKDELGNIHRSANEIEKGLELEWVGIDELIKVNQSLNLEPSRIRDTIFMEMILKEDLCRR